MNFDECVEKGLITKDSKAPERIESSLQVSERFLEQAKGNMKMEYYVACELLAYNSCFHSGRALLYSKQYRERSHVCLIAALSSLFENDNEISSMLGTFDEIRLSRHDVQYGGAMVSKGKAQIVLNFASDFLEIVKEKVKDTS